MYLGTNNIIINKCGRIRQRISIKWLKIDRIKYSKFFLNVFKNII